MCEPWVRSGAAIADPPGARNHSLLAHGTRAVGGREFARLLDVCLEVASWRRDELTVFPMLPET